MEYNESRPNRALGEVPPVEYARQLGPCPVDGPTMRRTGTAQNETLLEPFGPIEGGRSHPSS